MAREIPGDRDGAYLIASNGIRTEVVDAVPDWATMYWRLRDDPRGRPNWAGMRAIVKPPQKMSKSG